jgi:hypothetical protein
MSPKLRPLTRELGHRLPTSMNNLIQLSRIAWLQLLFGALVLASVAVVFSWGNAICAQEPSEDLVLVLNSVTHPTFYFPGSNRIANVVGFASSWIVDVRANYHFQVFLRVLFGILWPYLVFRAVLPARHCLLAASLFHAIVLSQFSYSALGVIYGSTNPYSTSLFFLAISFLAAQKFFLATETEKLSYGFLTFVFSLVGSAIAPTNTLYILLTVGSYGFLLLIGARRKAAFSLPVDWEAVKNAIREWRDVLIIFGLFLLSFLLVQLHGTIYADLYPEASRDFSSRNYTRTALSLSGLLTASRNLWEVSGGYILLLELALLVSLNTIRATFNAKDYWPAACLCGALLYVIAISQFEHTRENVYHFRYFIIAPLFLIFFFVFEFLSVVLATVRSFQPTKALASLALCVGTVGSLGFALNTGFGFFGTPADSCPFAGTSAASSNVARFAIARNYFAILGSYWDIWPIVFHAWEDTKQRPIQDRVFPTGYRAETFQPEIRSAAERRLMRDGSIKLLCVDQGKPNTEFGTIDCAALTKWNASWGVLPSALKLAQTQSPLGSDFAEISLALPTVNVGDRLDLRASAAPDFLLSGWSSPEAFGAWTNGSVAKVAFVLACDTAKDLEIDVRLAAWIGGFVTEARSLKVKALWNDAGVSDWSFTRSRVDFAQRVLVGAALVHCNQPNSITFEVHEPQMPDQIGKSPDKRQLGIAVQSISIAFAPKLR